MIQSNEAVLGGGGEPSKKGKTVLEERLDIIGQVKEIVKIRRTAGHQLIRYS